MGKFVLHLVYIKLIPMAISGTSDKQAPGSVSWFMIQLSTTSHGDGFDQYSVHSCFYSRSHTVQFTFNTS